MSSSNRERIRCIRRRVHIVFARAPNALWAVPFELDRLDIAGSPFPILENVAVYAQGGASDFGVSRDGSLVFVPGDRTDPESILVWVDHHGAAQPITEARRAFGHPRLSPDGTRLAVEIAAGGGQADIWVLETARETLTRLTFEGMNLRPIWTPDGSEITFGSSRRRNSGFDILSKPADGSGDAFPLTANDHVELPASWSPDGKTLVLRHQLGDTGNDIARLVPEDGGEAETIVGTSFQELHVALSRDGRWLAYSSDESGRREVYVRPFPEPGGRWQVSTGGGTEPVWAWSGKELFYRNGDEMWSVLIATEPTFSLGKPVLLFEGAFARGGPIAAYDVTSDDQRFVMIRTEEAESADRIHVVLNWLQELSGSSLVR